MESALEKLSGGGIAQGMKTSQTVTTEQQAKPAAQLNQETFGKMMHGEPTTPPKDEHEAAVRMNQATAKGLMNGTIKPIEAAQKKPEAKQPEQSPAINHPKSYAEMFAELNKGMVETPEQQRSREKKERTDAIVRSVGDGLSALSRMYFATKGAATAHNPQNDLTASSNKRKEYFQQQREKNKAAWLTGYQRALALDEEARKNDMTAAEAFRYHNMLNDVKNRTADQGDRKLDQGDAKLEQSQQRIDISKMKYQTDADWKDFMKKIKQAETDNKISHWQAQDALSQAREARIAANGGSGSSGNKKQTAAGYWNEYYEAMSTPEGKAKIQSIIRQNPSLRKVNQNSVRFIMDRYHGRKSSANVPSGSASKPAAKQVAKKQPTAAKKKSTGVNWK